MNLTPPAGVLIESVETAAPQIKAATMVRKKAPAGRLPSAMRSESAETFPVMLAEKSPTA